MNELRKDKIMLHAYRMAAKKIKIANGLFLSDTFTSTPREIRDDFFNEVDDWVKKMKKKTLSNMRDERNFITSRMDKVRDCEELQRLDNDKNRIIDEIKDMKAWSGDL